VSGKLPDVPPATRTPRADGRRNRETLAAAGRTIFARSGTDAPMREVARAAGDVRAALVGIVATALVTAVIAVLKQFVDPIALTGLYLFAIVPLAIVRGFWIAGIVTVAAYLAFLFFIVDPVYSLAVASGDTVTAFVISLAAAYTVSTLARRATKQAREAQLRAYEAGAAQRAVGQLADEQAALRRVATLVAEAVPIAELFNAVTREVGLQCGADLARMERFEHDRTITAIAAWQRDGEGQLSVGTRFPLEGASIAALVSETGQPARVDSFVGASGPIAREAQALGIHSSVGCPIVAGGRTWGVIAASSTSEAPFPPHTESRIADFTELVATAVSQAEARAHLVASRARLVTAHDEARRSVVRNLHDGVQQRLVHTIITLKLAQRARHSGDDEAAALITEALDEAEQANVELRELAHGLLPGALARGGLAAGVAALVSRAHVPVSVHVPDARFPSEIEASAYFVVAEALTNVAKHSRARSAQITAWVEDRTLHVEVRDDGVGGADPDGSGLLGLRDRMSAMGGDLHVESPTGHGTHIAVRLPLPPA
jgi:signal transduction histidine kinase